MDDDVYQMVAEGVQPPEVVIEGEARKADGAVSGLVVHLVRKQHVR